MAILSDIGGDLSISGGKLIIPNGIDILGNTTYTIDAIGFSDVVATISGSTLTVISSRSIGIVEIEYNIDVSINSINHTNLNNNTITYVILKNTSSNQDVFINIGTFPVSDNINVEYTDEYYITPGESGIFIFYKVNNILNVSVQEMFTTTTLDFDNSNKPFYVKDGTNYKYPLYKNSAYGLTAVNILNQTLYQITGVLISSIRPPKGIPPLNSSIYGTLKIGNTSDLGTIYYDVYNTNDAKYGSIYKGNIEKARFGLQQVYRDVSGFFIDTTVSHGDSYTLYLEDLNTNTTDTVSILGKTSTRISSITISSSDIVFAVQGPGIQNIKYSINNGTFITTPCNILIVSHSIQSGNYITVDAYAVDRLGNRISSTTIVKRIVPFYAYPDIIISTAITDVPSTKITQFASSSVTVSSVSGFSVSDWVMIHQTYYPAGNSNTTTVCPYEFKQIQGISGTIITFTESIAGTFSDGAQMIYTYRCTNFTLNSGITMTTSSWDQDTYKGGIIPIYADGTVTINGTIDVSGKGYQGIRASYNEALRATVLFQDGFQGKGYDVVLRGGGVGGRAGAGGGGNAGGGGGGGHLNNGSIGNSKGGTNSGTVLGGIAFGSTSGTYLTMGGSGGQGGHHDIIGSFQRGGDGGGAVYVQGSTISGSGIINADGVPGNNNVGVMRWQGGAGGGAGGMVLFKTNSGTTPFTNVSINGGIGVPGTISNLTEQVSQTGGNGSIGRFSTVPI